MIEYLLSLGCKRDGSRVYIPRHVAAKVVGLEQARIMGRRVSTWNGKPISNTKYLKMTNAMDFGYYLPHSDWFVGHERLINALREGFAMWECSK